MQTETLATSLTEQYGTALPPTLIVTMVDSARAGAGDPAVVERTARADLDALADAVRRSPAARGSRP